MSDLSRIVDHDDDSSLVFDCGALPADEGIVAAGHEPNGYLWAGVAAIVAPDLIDRLELDPEAGMFAAVGARADLDQLRARLDPLLVAPDEVRRLIENAEAEGFEFDD